MIIIAAASSRGTTWVGVGAVSCSATTPHTASWGRGDLPRDLPSCLSFFYLAPPEPPRSILADYASSLAVFSLAAPRPAEQMREIALCVCLKSPGVGETSRNVFSLLRAVLRARRAVVHVHLGLNAGHASPFVASVSQGETVAADSVPAAKGKRAAPSIAQTRGPVGANGQGTPRRSGGGTTPICTRNEDAQAERSKACA